MTSKHQLEEDAIIEIADEYEDSAGSSGITEPLLKKFKPNDSQQQQQKMTKKTVFGMSLLTVVELLEICFLHEIRSLLDFEEAVSYLKSNISKITDHQSLQVLILINKLTDEFGDFISQISNSETQLEYEKTKKRTYEELLEIFKPTLLKAKQKFSHLVVHNLFKILNQQKMLKENEVVVDLTTPNFDHVDSFAKLFDTNTNDPLYISQQFQFQTGDERKRLITPGEIGSHLIKIEITDTRDLKSCKSEKNFWQKVAKKGYFLLDVNKNDFDKKTYEDLNNILTQVGNKILKIKNVKKESYTFKNSN